MLRVLSFDKPDFREATIMAWKQVPISEALGALTFIGTVLTYRQRRRGGLNAKRIDELDKRHAELADQMQRLTALQQRSLWQKIRGVFR